jgi:hypothetical protein
MGSREMIAYILIVALLAAAALLAWRIRNGMRKTRLEDRKHVRIDLVGRSGSQSGEAVEDSR